MKNKPLLSIITVNYNGFEDTCCMIESLKNNLNINYEIIVVDNASYQDDVSRLIRLYPDITVVRNDENKGFAGGNNVGITIAAADNILFLNNDAFIEDDSVIYMIDRLNSDKKIGAVSPKIKFAFSPRNIQFAGYTPLSKITLRNSLIGFDSVDDGRYDTACITPYTHGAAMMVKREAIEKTGAMCEKYFLYYEELDWCCRISNAGYELWYEPLSTVYHKESRSTGRCSPLRVFYMSRSRLLFAWRNRLGIKRIMALLYLLSVASMKNIVNFAIKGQLELSNSVIRGCIDFFKIKDKK